MATQLTDDYETALARSRGEAVQSALDELRPHDDHPAIADAVAQLEAIPGGESEGAGEVEKAMLSMVDIERSARPGLEQKARARQARGALGLEYLSKSVSAYGEPVARARIEQIRKVEGGRS